MKLLFVINQNWRKKMQVQVNLNFKVKLPDVFRRLSNDEFCKIFIDAMSEEWEAQDLKVTVTDLNEPQAAEV